ncbi:TrkH family potassium uptake protein [Halarsenatibacter silvermanii]|uniref:Trk system potassium uptake protein TrkH n=1 Tax=Halarsenatibacter silvermanii TaxID=321763 RepID=A0A1G9KW68_9FIRM|nr:TrkH family potassium uptake protein [Halarsenatibacter silvermanii]SDL53859.1 trk system potassium uptake protein TrkH [Halarsenatibacter silvermanii]
MLSDKLKGIIDILGNLLILLGAFMFFPLALSLYFQESFRLVLIYLFTGLGAISLGYIAHYYHHKNISLDISASMIITGLGWLTASFVVAIPLTLGFNISFLDAYFEAMSGFTTTGITLISGLENYPLSLIFLRSLIQWLGGLGILSFFLLITFRSEGATWNLFGAEAHKISSSRPVPNLFKTIKILWSIYAGLSVLQTILLLLAGLSLFDAVIHTMTTLSTGGFSRYDASIAYFQQAGYANFRLIEYIFIIFMFFSGTNFLMHYRILQKNWREVLGNPEFKFYGKLVAGFTVIIMVSVFLSEEVALYLQNIESVFRTSLFQVISIMTTTGYETQYIGSPYFIIPARQLFLVMMLIGGCVGSTGGGVKVLRILILRRLFAREIKALGMPRRSVMPVTLEKEKIDWEDVSQIAGLFFAWLFILLVGGVITAVFSPHNIAESFSGMFSAVNNIGPSYITVAEMIEIHPVVKVTYIFGMLAGRLEIIPVIALFRLDIWKK